MNDFLPCPFCGGQIEVDRTDGEGNFHPDEYFDVEGAWSGLKYHLTHPYKKLDKECPIATHEDEFIGCMGYDSIEEARESWNKRI